MPGNWMTPIPSKDTVTDVCCHNARAPAVQLLSKVPQDTLASQGGYLSNFLHTTIVILKAKKKAESMIKYTTFCHPVGHLLYISREFLLRSAARITSIFLQWRRFGRAKGGT